MCMAGILWDALDNGLWKAVWTLWMVRRTQTRLPRTLSAQIATYCRTTGCHMSERWFPIMGASAIPWSMIEPCEKQAQLNHDQSLERLAERGGLAPCEALAVLDGRKWKQMPGGEAKAELQRRVDAKVSLLEQRWEDLRTFVTVAGPLYTAHKHVDVLAEMRRLEKK